MVKEEGKGERFANCDSLEEQRERLHWRNHQSLSQLEKKQQHHLHQPVVSFVAQWLLMQSGLLLHSAAEQPCPVVSEVGQKQV